MKALLSNKLTLNFRWILCRGIIRLINSDDFDTELGGGSKRSPLQCLISMRPTLPYMHILARTDAAGYIQHLPRGRLHSAGHVDMTS